MDNYKEDFEKMKALNTRIPKENETIDEAMQHVPSNWRYGWCENKICGCMGAANCSGRLGGRFTKAEWQEWVAKNPPPGEEAQRFVKDGVYDMEAHHQWSYENKRAEFEKFMKKFSSNFTATEG